MKHIFLILLICNVPISAFSQKYDNIWLLGHLDGSPGNVINFNYGFDSVYTENRLVNLWAANASICDTAGNLLFYTNGISIVDSSEQIMQNGDSLNPGIMSASQPFGWRDEGYPIGEGTIALPHPHSDSLYELFHIGLDTGSENGVYARWLYMTTIDMSLNNGKGSVIRKNHILLSDTLYYGCLEAIKHSNGYDWWVVVPELRRNGLNSNGYFRFLLTQDSIYGPYYQQIGYIDFSIFAHTNAQSAFSPDGTKYARYDAINDLDIYDFDRCTGLLSNNIHSTIQDSIWIGGGVGFSPSGRFLYVSDGFMVYQYDIWATDIIASKDTVAVYDGYLGPFGEIAAFIFIQQAPNNKLYISTPAGLDVLHVMHSPDSAGVACNIEQHGVALPERGTYAFPNFPHYRMGALSASACDTLVNAITIEAKQENWDITLYPNPTDKALTLESNTILSATTNIAIYNALGQLVQTKIIDTESNTISIKTDNLLNGVYVLQIQEGNRKASKVFVVSKK